MFNLDNTAYFLVPSKVLDTPQELSKYLLVGREGEREEGGREDRKERGKKRRKEGKQEKKEGKEKGRKKEEEMEGSQLRNLQMPLEFRKVGVL